MLVRQRIISAIHGAFVADAASMGTHWYYDLNQLAQVLPSFETPEFKNPPAPLFYSSQEFPGHYDFGMFSPYGEQMLFVAEYCASKGEINGTDMSLAMLDWAGTFGGRPDHALKDFVENMSRKDGSGQWPNCGADDAEAHCFMKVVPVTCMYAGKPERRTMVEEAIRVHQNNDMAVSFGLAASCMLEAVLLGSSIGDALDECWEEESDDNVSDAFERAEDAVDSERSLTDHLAEVGTSCDLPQSFIGPVHQLNDESVETLSPTDAYAEAVRDNIRAGGDTCGRVVLVASIIAAARGGPPESWVEKMDKDVLNKVDAAANAIADIALGSSDL